ncbi:hypothetical protein OG413_45020 [Streptomyces sp. NBC_01433]|uniref:hypothetical protein n=1 Tax=Streptomyces sp. NBC_01433 TaxID=2903864 RepID=UPI00224FDCD3|nr:hypothetical protein [Streptomyces sp. NBC_01433]MCX4682349.1 hypothetical protein [Streptomyces sp. NBC_01433]
MAVLNYRTGPWSPDENRPFPRRRGESRRNQRRSARRMAKRAEARLAAIEIRENASETEAWNPRAVAVATRLVQSTTTSTVLTGGRV